MKKYINSLLFVTFLILALTACKKEETVEQGVSIQTPFISKFDRGYVQGGDTLIIYGAALTQEQCTTEVFVNDRPCTILKSSADSLQVQVPGKTRSGHVVVTIHYGQQFTSVEGPSIEVKPTPLVKSFWPKYAYAGETITLVVENFSLNNADNHIYLGTEPVLITGGNQVDTLLVTLPANAHTEIFQWRTYDGPLLQMDTVFPIRQTNYSVSTVAAWIRKDPGYTFQDTLVLGYPVLAGTNYNLYKRGYDSSLNYINSNSRRYTIFLPADMAYYAQKMIRTDFIEKIRQQPYNYNYKFLASIVPDQQLSIADLHDGNLYNTPFTMLMQYYPDGTGDLKNSIQITEENGQKYANIQGPYGETNPRVKILREHRVGNATLIETDGELGYVLF